MTQINKVGIRELRKNLAGYLNTDRPLIIERHGETIGYYFPASNFKNILDLAEKENLSK